VIGGGGGAPIAGAIRGVGGVAPGPRFSGGGGVYHGGHHGGYRHHYRHRYGGFYPGFATGAFIGGALASSYGYYDDPAYYYGDDYVDDGVVAVAPGGGDVAYCRQKYRSYDVRSRTYLGYDGQRHPCP
jgi:hypothetical protein